MPQSFCTLRGMGTFPPGPHPKMFAAPICTCALATATSWLCHWLLISLYTSLYTQVCSVWIIILTSLTEKKSTLSIKCHDGDRGWRRHSVLEDGSSEENLKEVFSLLTFYSVTIVPTCIIPLWKGLSYHLHIPAMAWKEPLEPMLQWYEFPQGTYAPWTFITLVLYIPEYVALGSGFSTRWDVQDICFPVRVYCAAYSWLQAMD